jgi:glycosyltransferase involved in cell wall biosynthesis
LLTITSRFFVIVAIDASPALRPHPTGTEVYARELIEALAATRRDHRLRLYANAAAPPAWLEKDVEWRAIPFPRLWTHWRFARALLKEPPDVVFVPSHVLPLTMRVSSVVTIHDLGHRQQRASYGFMDWWYLELMTRRMARKATRLIAVSETTAGDLRRFYGVKPERISVIHSGVDASMKPQSEAEVRRVKSKYGLDRPYFLYVGRNHPRKNLDTLLRAFESARGHGLDASLVLAGPGHRPSADGWLKVLSYVPAKDLPGLYSGALALVLPSRFEGFGFPVLEAMSCGTAVISSTAGALPEIVGDAAILINPDDQAGWTEAMLTLSTDGDAQRLLINAGRTRSAQFSWQSTAGQVWKVLEQAAA